MEAVFNVSYADYDTQEFRGGKLIIFTPMINWYLNDLWRLEFNYGFAELNRSDLKGHTNFFQMRIQTVL